MLENQIILVNKESGITSNDLTNKIKKYLNLKKVGHTGTLDPLASGLMIILTNKCTKLSNVITCEDKEYIAKVKLGIKTDTLDITGNILEEKKCVIKENELIKVLNSFKGTYNQEVPIYSAVKIKGKKLYEYARENKEINLPKREVEIKTIELLEFNEENFIFKVLVSKGTYIRSLIRDILEKLNVIGTMEELIRTKQGNFEIENSYTLEEIKNNNYKFITLEELFFDQDIIEINDNEYKLINNGNIINKKITTKYCKIYYKNKLIAIYEKINKGIKPLIIL